MAGQRPRHAWGRRRARPPGGGDGEVAPAEGRRGLRTDSADGPIRADGWERGWANGAVAGPARQLDAGRRLPGRGPDSRRDRTLPAIWGRGRGPGLLGSRPPLTSRGWFSRLHWAAQCRPCLDWALPGCRLGTHFFPGATAPGPSQAVLMLCGPAAACTRRPGRPPPRRGLQALQEEEARSSGLAFSLLGVTRSQAATLLHSHSTDRETEAHRGWRELPRPTGSRRLCGAEPVPLGPVGTLSPRGVGRESHRVWEAGAGHSWAQTLPGRARAHLKPVSSTEKWGLKISLTFLERAEQRRWGAEEGRRWGVGGSTGVSAQGGQFP